MKPARITGLLCLALILAASGCSREESARDALAGSLQGRVFIMIVADSTHAAHLSTYGYERETSPYLTELSAQGVRARRALSQTSWTLSSIVSLFTGLVQERHGVLRQTQLLSPDGPTTLAEMFRAAGYRTVGFVENAVASSGTGAGRGFDSYDSKRLDVLKRKNGPNNDLLADAEAVLEGATAEGAEPLFLYLHLLTPHMPYTPPEPFASKFCEVVGSDVTGSVLDSARIQAEGVPRDSPDALRLIETYDAHIAFMDDRVRRLLEPVLRDHGEEVCVLFTSDHGEAFLQHGATGHNLFVYEEMVSIPWILAAPGALPAGVELPSVVSVLDVLPTIAELFGLQAPPVRLDGQSLVGTFAGVEPGALGNELEERGLYLSSRYPARGKTPHSALVEGRWKLVIPKDGAEPQLFDTQVDPEEQEDVSAAHPERMEAMAERVAETRARLLEDWVSSPSAPLSERMLRDLESLGYGGEDLEEGR